jgi:predicted lactoylglutathione lyase
MTRMIFVNLPVRDLAASTAFYLALGGEVNAQFSDEHAKSVMLSDAIGVMIMTHERFRQFTKRPIGDARRESYALLALSVDTRDAVDATVTRATGAGGRPDPNPVQDHGFMVNRAVEDPDGNIWEIIWMDAAALAQAPKSS